jgi:hypothetical protein
MSGTPEMVENRRSTATGLRNTELIGVDWELSSSIGLTRRTRGPWRSFEATRRGLGMHAAAALELAGARVSVTDSESFREDELRNLGFIPGGGTPFYRHQRSATFILGVEEAAADRATR